MSTDPMSTEGETLCPKAHDSINRQAQTCLG
jgi:hypothetical protein